MNRWILILFVFVITSCNNIASDDELILMNFRQTNDASLKILSLNEMKNRIVGEYAYMLADPQLEKKFPGLSWGSVVFIEDITGNTLFYWYIFYGQLPDGGLVMSALFDAVSGKFKVLTDWDINNSYKILSESEVYEYLKNRGMISNRTDYSIRCVYKYDLPTSGYRPDLCWKYEVTDKEQKMIHTDCGDFAAIYVEPFVMLNKGIEPTDTNISGVANVHARVFGLKERQDTKKRNSQNPNQPYVQISE